MLYIQSEKRLWLYYRNPRLPSETTLFLSRSISKLHFLRTFLGNPVSIATLLEIAESWFDLRKDRIFQSPPCPAGSAP